MNKRILAFVFALVAVAACLVLVFAGNFYRSTSFYLLGEGEGSFTPSELFFFPESQAGNGYYVASSGQWTACERLSWEVELDGVSRKVSYYRYGSRILCAEEDTVNFYGGNTLDRFVVLEGEKKYLVELSLDRARPLFEGSTLYSAYAEGIDAISADGSLCAGIEEGVLTLLTLEKSTFSPTEKKQIRLEEQGLEHPKILRFINERHLWLTCEKEGKTVTYLCDGTTGELAELPLLPEGFREERMSRVWHPGEMIRDEEKNTLNLSFFHGILGKTQTVSLSAAEFDSITPLAVSPNGEYAVVKLGRDGGEVWGSYSFEAQSLTLFEQRPQRVDFASEQVMVLQTEAGYRVVRIVH